MRNKIEWITKECKECGIEYQWSMYNKKELCLKCRQRMYNTKKKLAPEDRKKKYPLTEAEKRSRYNRIKSELNKAKTREERREIYKRELDYIIQSGIFLWLTDWRPSFKKLVSPERKGIKGRKKLNVVDPNVKLPDTRYIYE